MSDAILELKDIHKTYRQGEAQLHILQGASLNVKAKEILALVGPSGCGKSTLLHIAGLLDAAEEGEVIINGAGLTHAGDTERTRIRREQIGFVYQFHHLLPEFSAWENVILPQMLNGIPRKEAENRAEYLLSTLGLKERLSHRPSSLSGGEQQRVAIARALANRPVLLLMDEPTGNLDPATAAEVFSTLIQTIHKEKVACLMVTHNLELAKQADRMVTLKNGKITSR